MRIPPYPCAEFHEQAAPCAGGEAARFPGQPATCADCRRRADAALQRICRLVARTLGCSHAGIAVLEAEQWCWNARFGSADSVPPALLGRITLASDGPLVVADLSRDGRFQALVDAPRFYAGQVVRAGGGGVADVLCAWDDEARQPGAAAPEILRDLALQLESELERVELLAVRRRLAESEQRFRALVEPNPDAIYTMDGEGRFLALNEASLRLSGFRREQLIGRPFTEVVASRDVDLAKRHFRLCLAGEPQQIRLGLRRADGTEWFGSVSAAPCRLDDGSTGLVGVARDVTAQVEAEGRLRDSEQRLSLAWETSGQAYWDWNAESGALLMSPRGQEMLGYPASGPGSNPEAWWNLVHPQDRARLQADHDAFRAGHSAEFDAELRIRAGDGGYRWLHDHRRAVSRGGDGRPLRVIGIMTDIHQRKIAEEDRVRQAERMALAVQAGGVGIFEQNLDSGMLCWDARMYELFGLSGVGVLHSRDVFRVCHPEDRYRLACVQRRLRGGERRELDLEFRIRLPDGQVRHLRSLGRVLAAEDGERLLIGTAWDVSEARSLQEQLHRQATRDALSGLLNRYEFERRLAEALAEGPEPGGGHVVCFIDLDRFKVINDTAGHAAGDALLRQLGQLLDAEVRDGDVVARVGGDEFGLLLRDCPLARAERIANRLIRRIEAVEFRWAGRIYDVSASIGLTQAGGGRRSMDQVLSEADVACYAAKAAGRGRVAVYGAGQVDARHYHSELLVAAGIREALEGSRFTLFAQAVVPVGEPRQRRHYEVLVRMLGEDGKLIPPGAFVPAAERYELMGRVDRWVLEEVLIRQADRLLALPQLHVSLNLSANSLNDPAFLPFIESLIARSPLAPARIHLEITETAVVQRIGLASELIAQLRALGCRVMLDDFGAGLSSFGYLKHFRVDSVKIDGGFIRDLPDSAVNRAIVESIHGLARKLGATTVAEFVENDQALAILREVGVDYAQGYGVEPPRPLLEVLAELSPATVDEPVRRGPV